MRSFAWVKRAFYFLHERSRGLTCGSLQVYAVEYTDMAKHARTLVEANGLSDVVEVIQGSAESVVLPEKVNAVLSKEFIFFSALFRQFFCFVLLA